MSSQHRWVARILSRSRIVRDRRSVEITYVVVPSVAVFAVLVIALLLLRAGHLLGRLERRLRR
jgi:hypothetical protein